MSAVQIDSGTVLNTSGSNLSINFISNLYADSFTIEALNISFVNLRSSDAAEDKLSFTMTEQKKAYLSSDLPYFSTTTDTKKIITSGLDQDVTAIVIIGSDADRSTITSIEVNGVEVASGPAAKTAFDTFTSSGRSMNIRSNGGSTIDIIEGGSSLQTNILKIVIGFLALLVLGIAVSGFFIYIYKSKGLTFLLELDAWQMVLFGFTILICIVLTGALINYIYQLL